MRHWRTLLLCWLMLWLPYQALAGQFAPCPHTAEHATVGDHDHHHGHPAPTVHDHHSTMNQHHDATCIHCESPLASQDEILADSDLFCEQCQCCTLGGALVFPADHTDAMPQIWADHWPPVAAVSLSSRTTPPGLRPPLAIRL